MIGILQVIVAGVTTGAVSLVVYLLQEKHREDKKHQKLELHMLRVVMKNLYKNIKLVGMTAEDFAEFESLYLIYHEMGGNGEITCLYEDLKKEGIRYVSSS